MKAKTKLLIFPIFLGLIFGLFLISEVNATNYEWFENGGLESSSGMESPDLDISPFYYGTGTYWINTTNVHSGSKSLGTYDSFSIKYPINFLDSDYFTSISVYTWQSSVSEDFEGTTKMRVRVVYSDFTYSQMYNETIIDDEWVKLEFTGFVDPNKYIIEIHFSITEYYLTHYWDDFSLSATTRYGRFSWTLTPSPISRKFASGGEGYGEQVSVYKSIGYVLNGFIRNVDGSYTEDGTYQINGADRGILDTGAISDGIFHANLGSYDENLTENDFELIFINMTVSDSFDCVLEVTFVASENGNGDGNGGIIDTGNPSQTASLILDFFIYGIFFLVIPLTVSVYVGGATNPSLGITTFVGAETLMGAIGLSIGLINIWFMIVIIILDVLLIFAMIRGR